MIVAVTGGKGGVGKSTTSLNLGRELDAVVVDADLATADLPRGSGPDLHDVLAGRAAPLDAVEQIGPVRFLPCGRTLAGARAADLSQLARTVEQLERECGRVVIDCPAGLARDVGVQLQAADLAVLVTNPERTAMVDAFRTRTVALDLETPIAAVVLNKASLPDDEPIADRIEEKLGASTIPVEKQEALAAIHDEWVPVREHSPEAPAVDAFEDLAWRVRRCERRLSGRIGVM